MTRFANEEIGEAQYLKSYIIYFKVGHIIFICRKIRRKGHNILQKAREI